MAQVKSVIVLTLGGLLFAGVISTAYQWWLLVAAIVGTFGLILSLTNYPRRVSWLVLLALMVGIAGMLAGGVGGAASALANDVYNHRLQAPIPLAARMLLTTWLTIGPIVVGIIQAKRSFQRMRASV